MNFRDNKLAIVMITTVCILCLLGLSFTKAFAASKSPKQNKASVEDNLNEFLAIYKKDPNINSYEPFYQFMSSLDHESRVQLARKLLKESDGRIVYFASNILIQEGHMDEAIPSLADLITSGRDETDLKGRFAYDWVHSSDKYLAARIIIKICRYFVRNWTHYTDGERSLAYRFMSPLLNLDSQGTFSADTVERAIKDIETKMPREDKPSDR
jgi:hypothetical protein